ncbi:DEAD/DEAH box family ATP-dependent RNA helicase [Parapedobacter defluvii]|uniref:DEAD/DEAH box family ATP-dependent RNA helicase n=1 Tax=Parapedobacter defluvii TaxID=2045106 RepID=A0ABQ1LB66_9SPHI|nr:DEAD/DEAH box helicase [Parapedobacter defluvii]GGC22053.1 DEAD/DEAH box family ATP-dependent RNA helicase [Parapedobacter defluvii]
MQFTSLNLSSPLLQALESAGYHTPTPIQQQAIPSILQHHDVLACAQTGTGKTAAFSLPIIEQLLTVKADTGFQGPKALILAPTRELAIQIGENIAVYVSRTRIRHAVIFGGVSAVSQIAVLRKRPDILVATPGRLLDLLNQKVLSLQQVRFLVLDEADRMLDMGFIKDIRTIIGKIPENRQTMLFSATMPSEIENLARAILRNPERIAVTPVSSTVDTIQQAVYPVVKANKVDLLCHLVHNEKNGNVLVFSRTKHGADKIVRKLKKANITAEAIHGNKSQQARQKALKAFKDGTIKVLVATDIAARGIDIDRLQLVINFDLPNEPETYVHRIGRTGRAGESGRAWSFCDPEEREYLWQITKLIKQTLPLVENHPFIPENLTEYREPVKTVTPPPTKSNRNKKKKRKRPHSTYREAV